MRSPAPAFDLRAALIGELRSALEQLDAADREPHAVHRCRVHIKRARALARVGRACAPGLANVYNTTSQTQTHKKPMSPINEKTYMDRMIAMY